MVKKTEQFKGLKFGKLKIGYKTLITVLGMFIIAWLLTKNLTFDKNGISWNPTQDLKANIDIKR